MRGGRRHLLLDGRVGWRELRSAGLARLGDPGGFTLLELPSRGGRIGGAPGFGGTAVTTGVAVDADGTVYVLDSPKAAVLRLDPCADTLEPLRCLGGHGGEPRRLDEPRGLAASRCGDLLIADTGNRRVQVVATKGLVLRAIWGPYTVTPGGVWEPWDVETAPDGSAFVTDRANNLVHVFARDGRRLAAYDAREGDGPGFVRPTHLARGPDGRLYVTQDGADEIVVLDPEGRYERVLGTPAELRGRFAPSAIVVDDDGRLYVTERSAARLLVLDTATGGGTAWGPSFSGAGAIARGPLGGMVLGDATAGPLVELDPGGAFERGGYLLAGPLDSLTPRCRWHRIRLAVGIPDGTRVRVAATTSEWELTAQEIREVPAERWSAAQYVDAPGESEWDCLLPDMPGRYLWLHVELVGDGTASPVVRSAEAEFPRVTSADRLPAVYRENELSRDFLERFVSLFDSVTDRVATQVDEMAALFDPMATPAPAQRGDPDFLGWLASWLGLAFEASLPDWRKRRILAEAHRLFELRGTSAGLRLAVRLYTGFDARVVEHFRLRRWLYLDGAPLGSASELFGPEIVSRLRLDDHATLDRAQLVESGDPRVDAFAARASRVTVTVAVTEDITEQQRRLIGQVVELAKPAHVAADLDLAEPRMRIGLQAIVGVSTVIGAYPDDVVEGESRLGYDSVLGPSPDEGRPPTLRVGVRSRIGSNTVID